MSKRDLAFVAALAATVIYGLNYTLAKDVMPMYIAPSGFILLRVAGAWILFWLLGYLAPKEKITFIDFCRIALCAVFGVAINMLAFFKGLNFTAPINASVIMVITPVFVLIFSMIILKEKIGPRKIIGICIGLIGAVLLISHGHSVSLIGSQITLGNTLILLNAASYSLYLILVKPLVAKYHPFSFIKWLYLFGIILVLPFGWNEALEVNWAAMPKTILWKVFFVIVCTTFFTYLLNLMALKQLKPTTLSIFVYLQPVIATAFAVFAGSDKLNTLKIATASLIFLGVYLVSSKPVKN